MRNSKASKRCFHFDADGRPWRSRGCPRTIDTCAYVHPEEPEWKSLPPTEPPHYLKGSRRSPSPGRPRTPDYKTRYDGSPTRSRYSPRYSSDRRRTPSPRHSESSRRAHDDDEGQKRQSRDYPHRGEPNQPDERKRTGSMTSISTAAPVVPFPLSVPPSVPPHLLPTPKMPTPPPPQTDPPMPPPPPLPIAPSFLSTKRAPSPPPLTEEELRAIWLDRIKNLADCVQARNQYTKIEEDIADCRRLMETWRMPSLPDEDKGAVSAELAKLESRRDDIKKSLDEKISRLAKSNSWPISPRTEAEEGEVDKYQEMVKYVEELRNTATEMNRVLNDIREPNPTGEHEHDTPMDVDVLAGSVRPLKRRRLSDPEHQHQQRIAPEEADALQNNILSLEERFANFENDLTEHNQELMQEVTAYIESKVEEIAAAVKDVSANETNDLYDKADQEIKRMGGEVGELAEEMGALLLRANAQETETAKLQLEIEESKKRHSSLEQRFQDYVKDREKDRNTIEALKAALAAHVAHPPSPPHSPHIATQEYMFKLIEEPLLEVLHTNLKPLVENLRDSVESTLNRQNTEIYETLWTKLSLTLRVVETISSRMEKGDEIGL